MRPEAIPGYDPGRLDHRRAYTRFEEIIRDGAPPGVVAGIRCHWESWVYVSTHPQAQEFAAAWLAGYEAARATLAPRGNRAERRRRKRP